MSSKIRFIKDSHKYLTEDNKELISVSKFTDIFKEKVDWDTIAARVAQKETKNGNPTTKTEVLKKWEKKRILSAQIGTLYHSIREQEEKSADELHEVIECPFEGGFKYSVPINQLKNNTIYPELMIYDLDFMICGQADKVIVKDNKINIFDYKTDKEITFKAFSNNWVKPRKLLPPLSHLDDCNGNIYSIKMSMYMYLLWKANKGRLKSGDITIEHIALQRNEEGIPILLNQKPVVDKITILPMTYRKKEIMDILKTIKV